MKILTKTQVIYLKRKQRTCRMQIQVEKVWFVTKKMEKFNFEKKIFKGGPFEVGTVEKKNFRFSKFKIFFWKMASMGRGKCWEKQTHEIWAHFEHPPRNHERSSTRGGSVNPLPCRIGLRFVFKLVFKNISFYICFWFLL